jgi:hypothetical protein
MIVRGLALILLIAVLATGPARRADAAGTAGTTDDQGTCATLKPGGTDAAVELVVADPVFDNSVSLNTLRSEGGNVHTNWAALAKLTEVWAVDDTDTAGIAFGGVKTDPELETTSVAVDQYGVYYCSFFTRINIKIFYSTEVIIPSKFEPGSCAYQVVKAHEQMLLDANREAMESYVARLRNDLPGIAEDLEKGFAGRDTVTAHQDRQKADLFQAVNLYITDTVAEKMKELASIVNTPQELKLRMHAMDQCGAHQTPPSPQEQ